MRLCCLCVVCFVCIALLSKMFLNGLFSYVCFHVVHLFICCLYAVYLLFVYVFIAVCRQKISRAILLWSIFAGLTGQSWPSPASCPFTCGSITRCSGHESPAGPRKKFKNASTTSCGWRGLCLQGRAEAPKLQQKG